MKTAIVILADSKSGTEEAAGRVYNALWAAQDFKKQGEEVTVVFQGAGTRWAAELSKAEHPFHGLFSSVEDKVGGVSCACADVFGASTEGFEGLKEHSVAKLVRQGYTILSF